VWSNDPESSVCGSLVITRVSHARLVKGDEPDKKVYPGPPEGLNEGLTTPPLENTHCC